MHMADIGDHYAEAYDLLVALRELGVEVDHWSHRNPREDADVEPIEMGRNLREAAFTARETLETVAQLMEDEEAREVVLSRATELEIERPKPSIDDLQRLADLFGDAGCLWIDALLSAGDEKLALAGEAGLLLYRQAIEDAPRPSVHAEIGCLLLARAGTHDPPYSEYDFSSEWQWWPTYKSRGEMKWTELLRPWPELITEDRSSGPRIPRSARTTGLSMALDSYGRAYSYYLRHADELEGKCRPADGAELDWTELWRQLLVLDGLRVVLLELDRLSEVELTCRVFDIWSEAFRDASGAIFDDSELRRRFGETSGFIRGRSVEAVVQQAVEEARRKVVVGDPDAFAEQVASSVVDRLGPVPVTTRAQIEVGLEAKLGQAWTRPPEGVREQIVEAEWLRGVLEVHDGRDYTPVVVFYGKALESLLRYLSGSNDILSQFRRQLRDERVKVGWLPGRAREWLKGQLEDAINLRDPAAHGESGPYRPIARSRMARMRDLVVGSESKDGLLTVLHQYAKWP